MASLSIRSEASFSRSHSSRGQIWWTNAIFFVGMHILALVGTIYLSPLTKIDTRTAFLSFVSWQLAGFGITIGYHRLWSHRAFAATAPLRYVLALMGSMGFQGSIKWWVLRHRLHHRFTDSPTHDPYSATRGLWYSHCGWIFRKPKYARMRLIERNDLEADPVVRFQHKFFVPIALISGLLTPTLVAHWGWDDALGGFVWAGVVARLFTWHTTFCINSLAHWTGLQPYTEEVTARGNLLLALLTSGEGNHNFHHAFPKDFRNGPHPADWDPTKWIIYLLHRYTPLVPTIARTPDSAVEKARARMYLAEATRIVEALPPHEKVVAKDKLPVWSKAQVLRYHGSWVKDEHEVPRRTVLVYLEGCVVDVGSYLDEHPGGSELLLAHCVAPLAPSNDGDTDGNDSGYASSSLNNSPGSSQRDPRCVPLPVDPDSGSDEGKEGADEVMIRDATKSFFGGMNNHSSAAKEWMRCLRVARVGG